MPLTPGTRIGPYEVTGVIGAGGMGEVYQARDTKLNRDVALKVLASSVGADPDRLARFRREAQVLAALNHPNIAAIYGFEDSGPTHALVMELVDGQSLDRLIAASRPQMSGSGQRPASRPQASGPKPDTPGKPQGSGPRPPSGQALQPSGAKPPSIAPLTGAAPGLPLDQVLSIARQIAEALEFAHERGIIHRDLKPANVKVRDDGTVKVLDFGLAKALAPEEVSGTHDVMNSPTLTARQTQLGMIVGTAAYMAPEQAKGRPVDRRADIWAFGIVLYEMLTGRRGYDAEDVSDTLAAVLTRDVDWQAMPADAPLRLRALIRDCLARDPKQRLRDIGEARRVLDQLISGTPDAESVSSIIAPAPALEAPGWRRALPWAIALAAVIAAAAFAWSARSTVAAPSVGVLRSKMSLPDLSGFVAISRDGRQIVYTVSGKQGFGLFLRSLDQFEGRQIPGSEDGGWSVFSPDGKWIVYSTTSAPYHIKKLPVSGGTAVTVCDGSLQNGAAWGDDDTIVFPGGKGLMRVSTNGGQPQALTTLDASKGETGHSRPQFLPDGKSLLFTITSTTPDSPQFAILDLKTGAYRTVGRGGDNGQYAPTGHLTFVRDATLFAVPFDLARGAVTGAEVPLVDHISTTGPTGTGDYAFSESGTLVYSEALTADGTLLSWIDRRGNVQPIAGQTWRPWGTGRLSPDGLHVANTIHDAKGDDVWIMDLARGTPTRVTFSSSATFPVWTPDGKRIVYAGAKDKKPALLSVAADGSGQPDVVLTADSEVVPTSFSPDGKTLLYTQSVSGRGRVMMLPLDAAGGAREPHPLRESPASDGQAQVSPDGKWVVFTSTETGSPEIYVLPFAGAGPKVRISTDGGRYARWSHSGRELFFWTPTPGIAGFMSVDVQVGPAFTPTTPRELFRYGIGTTWDVTPDADRFLIELPRPTGAGAQFAIVAGWFNELRERAPGKK